MVCSMISSTSPGDDASECEECKEDYPPDTSGETKLYEELEELILRVEPSLGEPV